METQHDVEQGGRLARLRNYIKTFYNVRVVYFKLGYLIGTYPRISIFLSMLLSMTSTAMYNIQLKDSIREGYTALNAPSRYETQKVREFLGTKDDPMEIAILMLAQDGGSMHRKEYLDEALDILDFVYNLTVKFKNGTAVYSEMCEPYCFTRDLLKTVKLLFDINYYAAELSNHTLTSLYMTYPFISVSTYIVPLEQCFFGVHLLKSNITGRVETTEELLQRVTNEQEIHSVDDILPLLKDRVVPSLNKATELFNMHRMDMIKAVDILNETSRIEMVDLLSKGFIEVDPSEPLEPQITNMDHVTLILVNLYGYKNTTERIKGFPFWELGIHHWTKQYNKRLVKNDSLVKVLAYGNEILNMEVNEDNKRMAPYFKFGFMCMVSMVVVCVFSTACYYDALDVGKILIGTCATICPLLGITTTYGILSLFHVPVNSLLFVMPFLIMGIGVDAIFLMTFSWQRMVPYDYSPTERIGMVFAQCGPSITISSLTNVLSFGIGALTPTPEVRLFCFGSAVAVSMTFIFQLTLYGPALAIATKCEKPFRPKCIDETGPCRGVVALVSLTILRVHCAIISRVEIAILVLVLTLLYWYYSFQGVMNIDVRLDSEKILPKDSKLHEPNSLLTRYVWKEHLTPLVLVNTRFDLTDRNMTTQFWNVLKELETLPLCKGPASSLVWIREFANELNETGGFYPYETELDPTKLRTFLANDRRHLDRAIKFSDDSENATIESFVFLVSYTNVTNWDVRIKLMLEWRNVVGKYPELDMTVYESAGFFVDQMLSLRLVTTQTAIFTLASMTLLCAIFMGNLCGILTASASMASISLGVIGFMAKLGFDLDPVVMVSVLMTIGMSVDYVAHVAYHMQLDTKSTVHRGKVVRTPMRSIHEKLEHTVESVALPLAQAGISTVSCVLPLLLLPTYSSSVFVTAIVLVVTFGTIHSLVILPVFLYRLPESVTSFSIKKVCRKCCKQEKK